MRRRRDAHRPQSNDEAGADAGHLAVARGNQNENNRWGDVINNLVAGHGRRRGLRICPSESNKRQKPG